MNKTLLFILLLAVASTGCLKDASNYSFADPELIQISGLEDAYTAVSGVDSLVINPEVSSNKGDDFDYLWGIYETNVQGAVPVLDTIARTRDLNYKVNLTAKGWVLVYRVTNKRTGYAKIFSSSISVITPYTRGWYVAKDDGNGTDLDLFQTPEGIFPDSRIENVFSMVNGKKIEGKAQLLNYYSDYKSDVLVPGKFSNTKAMFIVTDRNASVVDINTIQEIHDINGLFYQEPSVKKPDFICDGSAALYFSNNGQLSSIYSMSPNTGQFGVDKIMDDKATPYKLSRYFIGSSRTDGPVLFDELSGSFVSASGAGSTMTSYTTKAGSDMKAQHTNKTCLYMGTRSNYPSSGVAVLKDKTDPTLMIIAELTQSYLDFETINDTIRKTDKILNATRFAVNIDENILYFVIGNELWSHNLANNFEQLQWQAPAGEEITLVRQRVYNNESTYAHNYIVVGTKLGDAYKVRMFTKSSGNLAKSPAFTLEGTGEVGDVIYISPSVYTGTYLNSY